MIIALRTSTPPDISAAPPSRFPRTCRRSEPTPSLTTLNRRPWPLSTTRHGCKTASWLKRNVLGNYEFAPDVYYGSPANGELCKAPDDANLNADAAPDRAIYNPAGVKGTGSDIIGLVATSGPQAGNIVAYQAVNPNAQYILARYGTIATSPATPSRRLLSITSI